MNSDNSKTLDHQRLLLSFSDRLDFKKGKTWKKKKKKNVALSNFGIYYTWKNMKKSYKNHELKISTPI